MNLQTKIRIDRLLFPPLVAMASMFSRFRRRVFGVSKPSRVRRIVVVKLTGMGSIIQSTPLLQTLRKNYPAAELFFISSRSNAELLQLLPMVNESWIVEDHTFASMLISCLKLPVKFFTRRIDFYFDLEVYSWFSTFLTFLSGAKIKLGLHRAAASGRAGIYNHFIQYNGRIPVSDVYLQMARTVQITEETPELFRFRFDQAVKTDSLTQHGALLQGDYVVINPNASELRIERRWGAKNFSDLINRLATQFPRLQFVITGSADEAGNVNEVIQNVEEGFLPRVINSAGQLSLQQLIQTISSARLVVTNDTGPMHLAIAMDIFVVALFGPCSPLQYRTNDRTHVIYKNLYCSPCVHLFLKSPCNGDNQCMKMIEPEDVAAACIKVLSGNGLPVSNPDSEVKFLSKNNLPLGLINH